MKHIFLINPAAGKKGNSESIIRPQIEDYCGKNGLDYEIYVTKCQGDAQNYCAERAKSGEALRFYACGGDGTLYEVVNGVFGNPNCEVAVIPMGSGNDFIRLFGTKEQFCNVEAQVTGIPGRARRCQVRRQDSYQPVLNGHGRRGLREAVFIQEASARQRRNGLLPRGN